jgi:hypothetical protein
VTITTTQAHGLSVGERVDITGVGVAGYNGTFTVASVPSPTTFTYTASQTGLAASGGGTATPHLRNNGADSQAFTVAVGDQPITATAATSVSATEGTAASAVTLATFTDADTTSVPADFRVSINWGDGTALDTTSGAVTGSAGAFSVTGTHTYKDAGKFTAQVTITDVHTSTTGGDNGGAMAMASPTVTVADAALTGSTTGSLSGTAGTPLNNVVVSTFTDASPNGTATDFTATINWGDGTPSTPGTIQAVAGSSPPQFQVLGSHTYANSGSFSPSVSVTESATPAADVTQATTTATATATIAAPLQTPVSSTPGPTISANQLYVDQLFFDLIGTPPTSAQLTQFTSQLDGGASRATIVAAVQALPGYKPHRVTMAYQLLGLRPTTTQVNDGLSFLSSHNNKIGGLRVEIMASSQYFGAHGGTTSGYVSAVGQAVLGHAMSSSTQTRFLDVLGSNGRAAAVRDLFRMHHAEVVKAGVTTLFQLYLHRAPTATELSTQTDAFGKGMTEDQVIAAIVAMDDYFNRALQTVSPIVTNTTLASSDSPAGLGQSVTFTATVAPAVTGLSTTPTGTVTFTDQASGTTLGTGTLSGGIATFTTTSLTGGTHTIVASYAGDSHFAASTVTLSQNITVGSSSTTVTSSGSPSVFGQPVTLTATVAPSPSGGPMPTGTVTFTEGTNTLGTGTLTNGVATAVVSTLSVGSHTITATYGGDTNYAGSTGTVTQMVNAAATSTAVTATPSPSTFGQQVTFTATVTATAPGTGTPTGSVQFTDGQGGPSLGTGTLNGSGVATLTTSSLGAGMHTIVATFTPTGTNFTGSSGTTSETVNTAATTTAVTTAPNPSVVGQSVALTATIAVTAPGGGTPVGSVTFTDGQGGPTLGTATVNSSGVATTTAALNMAGTHTIVATFTPAGTNMTGSSGTATQTVNQATTTTAVSSSANPSPFGNMVMFTATVAPVAPGAGTPTGTVNFVDTSTSTSLGSGTLDASGKATVSSSTLAIGPHTIQATYVGDTNYGGSSGTFTQTISTAGTTTAVTTSPTTSSFGEPVMLTAVVTPMTAGTGTPTGTVTFTDQATGAALGSGTLDATGTATASTTALPVGTDTIVAAYGGDTTFAPSNGTAQYTVSPAATSTALASTPNPSTSGTQVTFTATVTPTAPGAGTPTGTVNFTDQSTSPATPLGNGTLDTNGQATFSTDTLAVGMHDVQASYVGDTNFTGSMGTLTQTVNP